MFAGDERTGDRPSVVNEALSSEERFPVEITEDATLPGLRVSATVKLTGRTGVEMEALTAVSVACLTIYDMAKAIEKGMEIGGVRLVAKSGGKSGDYRREGF